MNSCLYEGRVHHARTTPREHHFGFSLYMICFDLDELDEVFKGRWLWSTHRPAFARFRKSDHLTGFDPALSLRKRLEQTLVAAGCERPVGQIRLLTQLRYLGFIMNPVSFYYCYDLSGERVTAVVAEVNNTPWGEQHLYVVQPDRVSEPAIDERSSQNDQVIEQKIDKVFHVSPFMSLAMFYRMKFNNPKEKLAVRIENFSDSASSDSEANERIFGVSMALKKKELNTLNLNKMLLSYPLISVKIFAGIYWQALRLFLKKIPFVPHPNRNQSISQSDAAKLSDSGPAAIVQSESANWVEH